MVPGPLGTHCPDTAWLSAFRSFLLTEGCAAQVQATVPRALSLWSGPASPPPPAALAWLLGEDGKGFPPVLVLPRVSGGRGRAAVPRPQGLAEPCPGGSLSLASHLDQQPPGLGHSGVASPLPHAPVLVEVVLGLLHGGGVGRVLHRTQGPWEAGA